MVVIEHTPYRYYMDNHLSRQLVRVEGSLKKDDDFIAIVAGAERAGKSVLAMQICKTVDPTFSIDQIAWSADEFEKIVTSSPKGKAILYDEAFSGLSSRSSLSGVNKQLITLMQEMGQRNLFIVIVLPSFYLLDWYAAVHRSRGLFMVYRRKGKRGYWRFYNQRKKNDMYELPRHLRSKKMPKPSFRGRFYEQYTVDEKEYRSIKAKHFRKRDDKGNKPVRYREDRDKMVLCLKEQLNLTESDLAKVFSEYDIKISRSRAGAIIRAMKDPAER